LLLPKLKLLTTAGTMIVSIAAYSFVFGWAFAAGSRAAVDPRDGARDRAPSGGDQGERADVHPFLGAVISAKSLGRNATAELVSGSPARSSAASAPPRASWYGR